MVSLAVFDLLDPEQPQPLLTGVTHKSYALRPTADAVAYDTGQALHVLDVDGASPATVDIELAGPGAFISRYGWSTAGTFIAAVTRAGASYQQRLVRIDESSASTPIDLRGTSSSSVVFRWQPRGAEP